MESLRNNVRKSKYEMMEMALAFDLVEKQSEARFPLGVKEVGITGKL